MLETEFQTSETRPMPFPWCPVTVLASLSFALGAITASAVLAPPAIPTRHLLPVMASIAVAVVFAWLTLRRSVREWQSRFGTSVEYVARRKREHEAGVRFQGP